MAKSYQSDAIEVLEGLEPVRKRPGMYTDTTRPNHLAQEVIDNCVDEALAGHANEIQVVLSKDQAMSISDNGRGMPVDIHKKEKVSGVELILTRLHSGAKFNNDQYRYSGGLHGVGVSVVNALSERFEVFVKRDGHLHHMAFKDGEMKSPLSIKESIGKRSTGTRIEFKPNPKYFDSHRFSISRLKHLLRAKAVLCPGLKIVFTDETASDEERVTEWFYQDGLADYLSSEMQGFETLPAQPIVGQIESSKDAVDWAVQWLTETGQALNESYVNLIPTALGGTHVNGLRTGLLEALREFCEFRNLLPRGVKITGDDIWESCAYVLSVKMLDPQFAGQTKDRLNSREIAGVVATAVKDHFSLWLNQHTEDGQRLAEMAISNAQSRLRAGKQVTRKKVTAGPALPGKLTDCSCQDVMAGELFLVEGDSAGGSAKQARDRETQAVMPLKGKILNTWEVDSSEILASQEVHDISVALGMDPGSDDLSGLRYGKVCILADADSDGLHISSLLIALFVKHFPALVSHGHVFVAMPPLYRIDAGKDVHYALDEAEREHVLARLAEEKFKGKISVQRFKGLGEMNALQLRETAMSPDTRRLVRLVVDEENDASSVLDMLLSKKRAGDRKSWLERKGDMAELV
jgi:topoisomerase-4 subunit B